jgi:hypothetical protein
MKREEQRELNHSWVSALAEALSIPVPDSPDTGPPREFEQRASPATGRRARRIGTEEEKASPLQLSPSARCYSGKHPYLP